MPATVFGAHTLQLTGGVDPVETPDPDGNIATFLASGVPPETLFEARTEFHLTALAGCGTR